MLISFVSAKGSPGVTTTTLALGAQWPRTAVVVDADPFGGDLPAGIGRGSWPPGSGLLEVVVDSRTMDVETALRRKVYRPAPHCPPMLAGFGSIGQAGSVPWSRIAGPMAQLTDADVLADCGRYTPTDGVEQLLRMCDDVVLITGSTLCAARSAARLAPLLRSAMLADSDDGALSVLVVQPGRPYASSDIAYGCELPLLGEIPSDPRAAEVWSDGATPGRWFARSALQREAQRIAHVLGAPAVAMDGAR